MSACFSYLLNKLYMMLTLSKIVAATLQLIEIFYVFCALFYILFPVIQLYIFGTLKYLFYEVLRFWKTFGYSESVCNERSTCLLKEMWPVESHLQSCNLGTKMIFNICIILSDSFLQRRPLSSHSLSLLNFNVTSPLFPKHIIYLLLLHSQLHCAE